MLYGVVLWYTVLYCGALYDIVVIVVIVCVGCYCMLLWCIVCCVLNVTYCGLLWFIVWHYGLMCVLWLVCFIGFIEK